jgi:predicted MFS family arabinose efflux permease
VSFLHDLREQSFYPVGRAAMSVRAAVLHPIRQEATASTLIRWYVLLVMCLVYMVSIADRYVISTVLEPIRVELHLSDSGVAFLTGVSLSLFYVSFGIPISLLADRMNRRNIIAISLVAWSAMTVLCGLAANYWQLLFARIGVGIGEAGGTPAANSIISDYFPAQRRPMALTIFSLGAPVGAWVGADVAGRIADAFGWRAVFLALGVPGVVFGALVYFAVREPERGRLDAAGSRRGCTLAESTRFLLSQRSACHLMLASAITALWGWGLTWWTPAFLMRTYGLSAGHAGGITGPIHLIAGTAATVFTGWFLGRPFMNDPRRVVWLLGGGIALATIPSIIIFATHSLALAQAMLWIFIPSIYFYIGPCFGLLNNLSPPHMRAQFCAATLLIANVGNLIIAPQLIGFLSDLFAPGHIANAASLRLALLCLAPTGFWSAYHYFSCARTLRQDQERAIGAAA